jgi:zinc protease
MEVSKTQLEKLGITRVREAKGIVEYKLEANGLKILLAENHSSPVVTVMPVYRVGSRNEAVGHTGATHILEHLMFKGVKDGRTGEIYNFPDRLKPLGAQWNATTWFDRTNYFECVASEHLELCIASESDRMRNLLLREEERASEMTVVRNELERGQNDPTRVLLQALYATAYNEHPYHHPTIGWVSDVEGMSIDRLKQFYDEFYWPDNATLLVMGDFDSAHALELVAKYYGAIERAPKAWPVVYTTEPKQEGERRFEVNRAGDAHRIAVGFHVPEASHKDNHALAAMGAILGGGRKTSRLYKALVDTGLASSANVWHFEQRDPGMFMVFASVAEGKDPAVVEKAILAEIEKLAKEPVLDDELKRAKTANRKGTVLQSADPMQMANQLAEAEAAADWTFYVDYDEKFDAVTADDVKRVASTYFERDNRTVGHFIPKVEAAQAAETPVEATTAAEPKAEDNGAAPRASFASKTSKVVLPNGLTVLVMPTPGSGVVGISGRVRAGGYFAPADKPLLASLTAAQLTAGSKRMTKTEIAEHLEELGSDLSFSANNWTVNFSTQVVKNDTEMMLALAGELLRFPVFPDAELAIAKMQYGSYFKRQMQDTEAVASNTLSRTLYPEGHVFHDKSPADCLEELKGITVDDLKAFHAAAYTPKGSIISVVGDITVDKAVELVKMMFGKWQGEEPKAITVAAVDMPAARKRIDVELKDKANTSIVIGHPSALLRSAADFMAARLANQALGGNSLASRLGKAVRIKAGYTYGIYSAFEDPSFGHAPFAIELSVNPQNVDKALALIDEIVEECLKNGITDQELADEAGFASGSFLVQLRRADAIASTLASFEFLGMGADAIDNFAAQAKACTKDEVNAALRKYIRPESFVTVVAGTPKK